MIKSIINNQMTKSLSSYLMCGLKLDFLFWNTLTFVWRPFLRSFSAIIAVCKGAPAKVLFLFYCARADSCPYSRDALASVSALLVMFSYSESNAWFLCCCLIRCLARSARFATSWWCWGLFFKYIGPSSPTISFTWLNELFLTFRVGCP